MELILHCVFVSVLLLLLLGGGEGVVDLLLWGLAVVVELSMAHYLLIHDSLSSYLVSSSEDEVGVVGLLVRILEMMKLTDLVR